MASTSPRRSGDPPSPSSPLLPSPPSPSPSSPGGGGGGGGPLGRRSGLRGAARFIRRTGSRRLMREPSVAVRETAAAEHLEERQTDWAYSKPVVVAVAVAAAVLAELWNLEVRDVLWNLAFFAVAAAVVAAVLAASLDERPLVPLRAWLAVYVVKCLLHVLCVVVKYGDFKLSVVKHLESANTMFSFIWWIVGFYWVSAGGTALSHDAPQLYWLTIVFLVFDVFFVIVIGIAVCCIIAILYPVTDQEGASKEDINNLSKYKFRTMGDADKLVAGIAAPVGGVMTECGTSPPVEHILSAEDAECCICLCPYEDGVELRELPCNHHFHCACIDEWLHINATCPWCKFNIVKSNLEREEV